MRNTERPDIQPIMNNEQVMPATLTRRDEQVMKEKFKKSFSQELP